MKKIKNLFPIKRNQYTKILLMVFALMIILIMNFSCAQVGSPTGGPRDSIAPHVISTEPANYATGFDEYKFEMTFDEYVQLKDENKELVVSPLMEKKPEVHLKGKKAVVEWKKKLRDSATYTFDFGQAICDLNECNPLGDYTFVLSTGETIDSMQISGTLVDAFTHEAQEDIWVMAYKNHNDSTPMKEMPFYISRTDTSGCFVLPNIEKTSYRLFALDDVNSNLIFDQPNEKIAFVDSFIMPSVDIEIERDTLRTDSTGTDSIVERRSVSYQPDSLHLFLFTEDHKKQYNTDSKRESKWKLLFVFNRALYRDSVAIVPLNFAPGKAWFIPERAEKTDSLACWITDSAIYEQDTLRLTLEYFRKDSLGELYWYADTLEMCESLKETQKRDKDTTGIESLDLKANISGKFHLHHDIVIETSRPVATVNKANISLFYVEDSVEQEVDFKILKDTSHLRMYRIKHKWNEVSDYKLVIDKGGFTDVYGFTNDSTGFSFETYPKNHYGSIILNISAADSSQTAWIVQRLDGKDNVKQEVYLSENAAQRKAVFDHVEEGKYRIKLIYDRDRNKKWDTGNYLLHRQPEKVLFFDSVIDVKAGWDNELQWKIK